MTEQATRIKDQAAGDYIATRDANELDAEAHSRVIQIVDMASRELMQVILRGAIPVASADGVALESLPSDLTSNLITVGDKKTLIVNPNHLANDGGVNITPIIFNAAGDTVLATGEKKSSVMGIDKFRQLEGDSETYYPVASSDDGYWWVGGTDPDDLANWDTKLIFGDVSYGDSYAAWIRFPNLIIPAGASIDTAFVRLNAFSSLSDVVCNVNCFFNDEDSADTIPTTPSEANALSVTGAIAWSAIPAWTDGILYDTPELKTILQTVIDKSGWTSGNAVMALIKNNVSDGWARREASAIEYLSEVEKAALHVTWSLSRYHSPQLQWDVSGAPKIGLHITSIEGTSNEVTLKGGVI